MREDEEDRENREREERKLKSYAASARPSCPFYGFEIIYEVLVKNHKGRHLMEDGGGDKCAFASIINLPRDSYCLMEAIRDKPNWASCSLNTIENRLKLSQYLDKIRVFPGEFRPAKVKSWDGMSLKIWIRHIADMELSEERDIK